jgi:hypothetical protein
VVPFWKADTINHEKFVNLYVLKIFEQKKVLGSYKAILKILNAPAKMNRSSSEKNCRE